MPDAEDQHDQTLIFDLADEPVVAHAVFPELPKLRAVRGLSEAARIVQLGVPLRNGARLSPRALQPAQFNNVILRRRRAPASRGGLEALLLYSERVLYATLLTNEQVEGKLT